MCERQRQREDNVSCDRGTSAEGIPVIENKTTVLVWDVFKEKEILNQYLGNKWC